MLRKFTIPILFFVTFAAVFFQSCGKSYDDIHNAEGRRAILDKANSYLTSNLCNEAQDVLKPLYQSIYADTEIRLTYASTWACKAGLNFAILVGSLLKAPSDIWAALVLANYNNNTASGKPDYLKEAAKVIRETTNTSGSLNASTRGDDANLYMTFVQLEIISTTISMTSMGNGDPTTGKKTIAISGKGSNQNICDIQVAISTISDSLSHLSTTGTTLTNLNKQLNNICGGGCVTNLDPAVCNAGTLLTGAADIVGIDNMWGF